MRVHLWKKVLPAVLVLAALPTAGASAATTGTVTLKKTTSTAGALKGGLQASVVWSDTGVTNVTYSWRRENDSFSINIPGKQVVTSNLYTPTAEDKNYYISVCVSGKKSGVSVGVFCSARNGVVTMPPKFSSISLPPTVAMQKLGSKQLLQGTTGSVDYETGRAPGSVAYLWKKGTCDDPDDCSDNLVNFFPVDGTSGTAKAGTVNLKYTPVAVDTGSYLVLCAVATSPAGNSAPLCSTPNGQITGKPQLKSAAIGVSAFSTWNFVLRKPLNLLTVRASSITWGSNAATQDPNLIYYWQRKSCTEFSNCGAETGWKVVSWSEDSYITVDTSQNANKRVAYRACMRGYSKQPAVVNRSVIADPYSVYYSKAECSPPNGQLTHTPAAAALSSVSVDKEPGKLRASTSVNMWDEKAGPVKTLTYVFKRSSSAGGYETQVQSGSSPTYTLTGADANKFMTVCIIASNDIGDSEPSCSAPDNSATQRPEVTSGAFTTKVSGSSLSAQETDLVWSNDPVSFAYKWQRCATKVSDCPAWVTIDGATAADYTPNADNRGYYLRVCKVATNGNSISGSVCSSADGSLTGRPEYQAGAITVSKVTTGSNANKSIKAISTVTWNNGAPKSTIIWQRCSSDDVQCQDPSSIVTQATSSAYNLKLGGVLGGATIAGADTGQYIRACAVGSNGKVMSEDSAPYCSAPISEWSVTGRPYGSGGGTDSYDRSAFTYTKVDGVTVELSAAVGMFGWENNPTSYTYRWDTCTSGCGMGANYYTHWTDPKAGGSKGTPVNAAGDITQFRYNPKSSDTGKYIRLCVQARNGSTVKVDGVAGASNWVCLRTDNAWPNPPAAPPVDSGQ